jgi:DNA-directed RNA polymerase subunit RPC12/RpoP
MAKRELSCTKCGYTWEYNYFEWVWKAPMHMFNFITLKDKRRTKCPKCNKKSWIYCN